MQKTRARPPDIYLLREHDARDFVYRQKRDKCKKEKEINHRDKAG